MVIFKFVLDVMVKIQGAKATRYCGIDDEEHKKGVRRF